MSQEHTKKASDRTYSDIGSMVGKLVEDKQKAYGDSFGRSGRCLPGYWISYFV